MATKLGVRPDVMSAGGESRVAHNCPRSPVLGIIGSAFASFFYCCFYHAAVVLALLCVRAEQNLTQEVWMVVALLCPTVARLKMKWPFMGSAIWN